MNIVYFLRFEWDTSFRRPYHVEMAKYARILAVEFPVTLDLPLRYWSSFHSWRTQRVKLRQVHPNLYLYRPFSLVCYYLCFRLPFLIALNRRILARSLTPIISQLGMEDLVVMINHPMMEYVIGALDEKVVCYEVFDEYPAEYGLSPAIRRELRLAEERVLRRADVVFTSSQLQMEHRKPLNSSVYLIPHAVDTAFFAQALNPATEVPPDVATIPPPRLGLVGNMSQVDVHLLLWLMTRHPEWSLFIIGKRGMEPIGSHKLFAMPNVYHLGFKDYSRLPGYMKGLDVGLIPYSLDARTKSVFPNKLYQYLAAGKPVVSTGLSELKPHGGIMAWCNSYHEFEVGVQAALRAPNGADVMRRVEIARQNSIEERTETKMAMLRAAWERKNRRADTPR